jgi:adenine-specific DNA-methyltransferase
MTEDGYIVVSIDDEEQSNLKQIMDTIFGQENYLATLVWDRNRKNDAKYFSVGHEYMLVYAKNESYLKENDTILRQYKNGVEDVRGLFATLKGEYGEDWQKIRDGLRQFFASLDADDPKKPLARYTKVDERGPYRDDGDLNWPGGGGPTYEVLHPTTGRPCRKPPSGWRYPTPERFWEEVARGRVVFGDDETTTPRIRRNLFDSDEQVMGSVAFSYAQTASNDFAAIFDGKRIFDNPKNFKDIALLVEYLTKDGDLILDFFAGSASTAHSVVHANLVQGTQRKYIMVQLPEPVDPQSDAASLGLRHISGIGTDRMRRVRAKTKVQMPKYKGDLGFRLFKLGASAFQEWNGQAEGVSDGDLLGRIDRHASHLSEITTANEVLFELLLKDGFPIITAVDHQKLAGKTVFSIARGALLICLDKQLTQEVIDAMADMEPSRVICLDAGFQGNDQLKANAVQTFKARARNRETAIEFRTV